MAKKYLTSNGKFLVHGGKIIEAPQTVEVEALSVTANGKYTAAEGKAYSPVTVKVQHSSYEKQIIERTIESYTNDNINSVGANAFTLCRVLKYVSLPNATAIENYAFDQCAQLMSVSLPKATTIGMGAFNYCFQMTEIAIPNVTDVGSSAFNMCLGLTSISLPKAEYIQDNVFNNCNSLEAIILSNPNQVCVYGTTESGYDPRSENLKIYVPQALLESYKTATNWSRLADKFVAIEGSEYE